MRTEQFNEILNEQITTVVRMLGTKREEYAGDKDVLHNFKQAAHMTGETIEQALAGMMVKHTVSVYDMVESGEQYSLEVWNEKITDHINYLILLKAIVTETHGQDEVVLKERFGIPQDFVKSTIGANPFENVLDREVDKELVDLGEHSLVCKVCGPF